jgi:hypothetical protein
MLLYSSNHNLYNGKNRRLTDYDPNDGTSNLNRRGLECIQLNDSTFLVFGNFLKVPNNPLGVRQLTITQIIVDKNGKFKVSPIGLDSIFQDRTAECLAVIPDTSGGAC